MSLALLMLHNVLESVFFFIWWDTVGPTYRNSGLAEAYGEDHQLIFTTIRVEQLSCAWADTDDCVTLKKYQEYKMLYA